MAGILTLGAYGFLALQSVDDGTAQLTHLLGVCGPAVLLVLVLFEGHRRGYFSFSVWTVLLYAVLFRAVGLASFPVLEDDFYRYLWDGWQTVQGGSPYGVPPAAYFDVDLVAPWSEVLDGINYPDVPTVYGPSAQWLFALAYHVAPGAVWPVQLFAALADIWVIVLLARLAPVRWVLLYAWSPLLIKEAAFTGHFDVVGVALVVSALFLRLRYAEADQRTWVGVAVGVLVALACGIKVFAFLAVPFLIQADWRAALAYLATLVVIAWPFGLIEAWFPAGLSAMGQDWVFNAPLYILVGNTFGLEAFAAAKLVAACLFCLLCVFIFLRTCSQALWPLQQTLKRPGPGVHPDSYLDALTVLFGALMFVLPAFNPWYLTWWLALAVLRPSFTAWTCSVVLLLSYASGINLADPSLRLYQHPTWVLLIEYGCILAAMIVDCVRAILYPSASLRKSNA